MKAKGFVALTFKRRVEAKNGFHTYAGRICPNNGVTSCIHTFEKCMNTKCDPITTLGKSNKANQDTVISEVLKIFGG